MRVKSISWGKGDDPGNFLTIGEFEQGSSYRTIRRKGTKNFLFILTLGGSGRASGEDGGYVETQTGDILLYDPGAFHQYGTAPGRGYWNLAWSHFVPPEDWDYWKAWESPWQGLSKTRIGPLTTGRVRDSLGIIHDGDFGSGSLLGAFMLNCLQRAFLHIRQAELRSSDAARDARVQKALHVILRNLAGDLSMEALARQCGLSVSRFAHLFKEEMESTPQQFVERRRMEQARNLLRFSNLPIAEVARACGFEDPYYFSSRFRKRHGISPSGYRGQGTAP
ncbi:MAG: helix-turn-helix domain-containing protein [Oceanipulchritudo sp.]